MVLRPKPARIAVLLACCWGLGAQTFDVASIKPEPWTNEGGVRVWVRGNMLTAEHADLYLLVEFAYGLRTDGSQISGGPGWAHHGLLSDVSGGESTLYHVIAKAPEGAAPPLDEFRRMLQALLAGRFQLRVHHVALDLRVFHLVVARDGPKFKESPAGARPSLAMRDGFA